MYTQQPQGVVIQQQPQQQQQSFVPVQQQQQQQQQPMYQPAPQQQQQQQTVMGYNDQAGGFQAQPVQQQQFQQQPVQQPQQQPQFSDDQVAAINSAQGQLNQFFVSAGITSAQVEQEFQAFGKLTDGTRKALVDKHGEATANLVANQYTTTYQQKQAADQQNVTAVHNLMLAEFKDVLSPTDTGESVWAELDGWARTNIPVAEREQLNEQLDKGGLAAELAIKHLVTKFKSMNGMEQSAAVLDGNNLSSVAASGQDLTITQYNDEMAKLQSKGIGYDSPQAEALKQRRQVSRNRGVN